MSTAIVELRQYLLHPNQRDTLIELFDREFVETQEAVGMAVLGQFRDPDRPDYFVWLRGFTDMKARHKALTSFYGGPVWAEHRAEANATMIDSDNVLLLRPVTPVDALPSHDPARRATRTAAGTIVVVIDYRNAHDRDARERFRTVTILELELELERCGARTIGLYETEHSPNTLTALPVRTDDATLWLGAVPAGARLQWQELQRLAPPPGVDREVHRLVPTARSALDGSATRVRTAGR